MELRVLRYFLAVAEEGGITRASERLNLTQPTLSRQIHDLEEELGQQLIIRGSHSIKLTEAGALLKKRAEEILSLSAKTESEVKAFGSSIEGQVNIGAGETRGVQFLTKAAFQFRSEYPDVRFNIMTGDSSYVTEHIDNGILDFGLLVDPVDLERYESIRLPFRNTWGIIMRKDSPLSKLDEITPKDLEGKPLIISRQVIATPYMIQWFGKSWDSLSISGTYSLAFNGSLMAEDALGYALCLDGIVNITDQSPICFRPLSPKLDAGISIAWKKRGTLSAAAEKYLEHLRAYMEGLRG